MDITSEDLWTGGSAPDECQTSEAYFYAQFECLAKESDLHTKYNRMALTVATTIVIAYLFTIALRHLYQGGKIQQMEWDMSTITAGDYTVEFKIDADRYRHWYNNDYRKPGGDFENQIAPAMALK